MGKVKSILLVDDDDTTNFLNTFFIRQVDSLVEVNVALNGKDAIDFLVLHCNDGIIPCLLILDINMPVMDGWEFLKAFDKKFDATFKKSVIIVMVTSLDFEQMAIRAKTDPNISDMEQKPLSDLKFKALINKHFQ